MTRLQFLGDLPAGIGLVLALFAAWVTWAIYRRETRGMVGPLRWLLPTLRAVAVALGVLLLIGPVLVFRQTIGELGRVTVVLDASDSMTRQDRQMPADRKLNIVRSLGAPGSESEAIARFDGLSRWDRMTEALFESPTDVVSQLQERHRVTVVQLAGDQAIREATHGSEADQSAEGGSISAPETFAPFTDLSVALAEDDEADAVVLLTDGRHNRGDSPSESAQQLARRGAKIFPVAIGAVEPAADLVLGEVDLPDRVFATDRVRGSIAFRDTMPPGSPFTVQVTSGETVLWEQKLLTTGEGRREVTFDTAADQLAEGASPDAPENDVDLTTDIRAVPLEFRLSAVPGEAEERNNARPTLIAVSMQPQRVLVLDGRPRWETRYLRNALERDTRWEVRTVIADGEADALPRGEQGFPTSRDDLFGFDLIVLGELSPATFTTEEFGWLTDFVAMRGGGLIVIDGLRGDLRTVSANDLLTLLPIRWTGQAVETLPSQLRLTAAGTAEPALRLLPDETDNAAFWKQLPAPHTLVPTAVVPGGEVLAEAVVADASQPAIVARRFGAGRVLYFAFDETWRWRYNVADRWHQTAWNQFARFAMPEPYAAADQYVALDTGPVRYDAGDSVDVRVRLRTPDGAPATDASVEAVLQADGQPAAVVRLTPDEAVPGVYRGQSAPLPTGEYDVIVRAAGYAAAGMKARTRFRVEADETPEAVESSVDAELLRSLASATEGQFLWEEDIARLPELLEPLSRGRVLTTETPLAQSWWWFLAMIALLTTEWLLRKRAGLL